jgi:hypothetical protein
MKHSRSLSGNTFEVSQAESNLLIAFLDFIRNTDYGEFRAIINTNPKTKTREIRIEDVDKDIFKLEFREFRGTISFPK